MPRYSAVIALLVLLALAGAALAAPLFDPATMVREQELRPGMRGYGLTVFEGTKVEKFGVTVLGVLKKIDFGANLVLVRITSGPAASRYGVVAGMSGSPVYVGGKLVGALSFAFPFAKESIAGVTPIAQMLDDYQPGSAPPAKLAGTLRPATPLVIEGKRYDRATVLPSTALAAAGQGLVLTPIATPLLVSGGGSRLVDFLSQRLGRHGLRPLASPLGAAPAGVKAPPLGPGSAAGVQLASGDVDMVAVGTVTYVKDGLVLAFGHPLMNLGGIDMPLVSAYVQSVVPSMEVSFKLASGLGPVGRITQDRSWCIGGKLGEQAQTTGLDISVKDLDRGNSRDYFLQVVRERELTASLIYGSLFAAIESLAPALEGTTTVRLDMTAPGLPPLHRENSYARSGQSSMWDLIFADSPYQALPMGELMELMDTLENNRFGPIPVDRIKLAVGVSEKRRTALVERAYADRHKVRPGETVHVSVDIQPYGEPKARRELEVAVPANAPPGMMRIGIGGGASASRFNSSVGVIRPRPTSLSQMVEQICRRERSTDLLVETVFSNGSLLIGGLEMPDLPNSLLEMVRTSPISSLGIGRNHARKVYDTPWVLSGSQVLRLTVETDQKEKGGSVPSTTGMGGEDFSQMFSELFRGEGGGMAAPPVGSRLRPAADEEADEEMAEEDLEMPDWDEVESMEPSSLASSSGGSSSTAGGGSKPGRRWVQATAAQFAAGKLEGTAISGDALTTGPAITPLFSSSDRLLWATAASDGRAYVACWLTGEVLALQDGKSTSVLKVSDPAITAMATGSDGTVWAAAMPSGQIYRIAADGTAGPYCRLDAPYIWALAPGAGGRLYAATGPAGRVWEVTGEGQARVLFQAPDRHVMGLAVAADGAIFAGTYPLGKVFRVQPDGQARAYFEVPKYAIQSLALDEAGNLFVGTSPKAEVYRVAPDGTVKLLYQGDQKHVHALLPDGSGGVYAGTGQAAKVLHLLTDGTVDTVYDSKAAAVLALARQGGDMVGLESGSGRLVKLAMSEHGQGQYLSPVLDATGPAHWGRLRLTGSGSCLVETRAGDTAAPDATWAPWVRLTDEGLVASPQARYLQYRLTLAGDPAPRVQRVELAYRARNRQPEVKVTAPAVGDVWSGKKTVRLTSKDPDSDRLDSQVFVSADNGKTWQELVQKEEPAEAKPAKTEGKPAAKAPAPDREKLKAAVKKAAEEAGAEIDVEEADQAAKKAIEGATKAMDEGEGDEEESESSESEEEDTDTAPASAAKAEWDTTKFKDGSYLVRAVVTDRKDNPDNPLSAEKVAGPVTIDNSKPVIERIAAPAGSPLSFGLACRDTGSYVAGAQYRVDKGEWLTAGAADSVFDSPREELRLDPTALPTGPHKLEVKARDAAGNEQVGTFTYIR